MNDAIDLTRKRDRDFTAAVEAQSGQNVSTCYQCGSFCPRPDNKRTNRFTEKSFHDPVKVKRRKV